MTLDDRIYCLQNTNLPDELQVKLVEADIAYIQDRDDQATLIITQLENECRERGITIYLPKHAAMLV
ncbi:hypothetical protein [Escherichia coli]|uniref:hypothetical protein n=1 Tax=Escherichia coli TaxID=562 RepID=UPI0002A2F778|nr:hypothetical protein [Escherichia coli]ELC54768.1 hypothetical protein WGI_05100 [Escherichia coli KTE44]